MQDTELGHFAVEIDSEKFTLTPSFRSMAKLANASDLLLIFRVMHSKEALACTLVTTAREIMLACSDKPKELDKYLINMPSRKPHIKSSSAISAQDQVVVAAALMRHGVAGVNRPKTGLKAGGTAMTEFNVYKHVADAKQHFGLSIDEAWDLTMSEFCYHLASAFPPESAGQTPPSIDAHKAAMEADKEAYEKAMASQQGVK